MKIRIAAAIAGLAMLVGACSGGAADLSDEELRDSLLDVLTDDGTFDTETASCVVDELFSATSRDQLNRMADADNAEDISPEDVDVVTDAVIACL